MNNTLLGRLKTCRTEKELKDLASVALMQMQTLKEDYYSKRIDFIKFNAENIKLNECLDYIRYLCDIWNIERMV